MGISHRLLLTRFTSLVALCLSAALLMEYRRPNTFLCGVQSHCADVISSRFSTLLGVPLPILGILTFAALFGLSFAPALKNGWILRGLAFAAGVGGLLFILLQVFVLHRICPYCLIIDCCAITIAWSLLGWRLETLLPATRGRLYHLWLSTPVLAVAIGVALGAAGDWSSPRPKTPPPPEIKALWVPDKVTVIEIADFRCPHCRSMHTVLTRYLASVGDDIHFVRIAAAMPRHPQARDAARAFLCAQAQGKGEDMAEALFGAGDLTPASCERIAASLDISMAPYRACVADPSTDRRLDSDMAWVQQACPQGLPAIWVQDQLLSGVQSRATLAAAMRAARQRLEASSN